jgi:tetratricopeptide (TPR) repeat protein
MKKIILLLLVTLGVSYTHAQSIERERDSLKLSLQNEKTDTGRVLTLANLSFTYLESKPDTTMVLALEALSLASKIGFVKGEAISLNRVGNAYRAFGNNYPKAMEIYLQALKLNEKINNTDGIQRNNANIGAIYNLQGDYRLALEYFFKSKELAEKINNKASISIVLTNIGESYYHLKIYDSARIYQLLAHDVAYGINYFRVIGGSQSDLGDIYFETGQNALAIEFYRFSIPYLKKAEHDRGLSKTYLGMAKVFEKNIQNDSALYYAKLSLQIAQRIGLIHQVRDAGRFLSSYYRNMRIQDSAYFYQDITKIANDSLFSQQKQKQFQSLAFDEKLRQQEIAAAELKAKEERSHNLQYAAIAIGLITFIILFFALSRSIIVKTKFIEFFGVLGLLAVFEFINLFIHPYLSHATNDSPVLMLLILIGIGALLVPLHHKLEKWITKIMVEKNKKIRLAAAKKTIQQLEGNNFVKE